MAGILGVSGSLQAKSSNCALLRLAQRIADGVEVEVCDGVRDLPHFDLDLERDAPNAVVSRWRARVAGADGILIASPEYAHSLPGSLKNALDWLVGTGELYGKPVAVLSASPRPGGGALGRAALEQTLRAQGAHVVLSATVAVPSGRDAASEPSDSPIAQAVSAALEALLAPGR